ncbi:Uma2 family endonuclease [Sphaerospermopsis aphanizomenoides BCCUSP55]|uniref:Uma2 family endonuclease n=1 Tax=Sphaerospermopsis aphanizomenoides TaxID=459663 RepID=UPI0019038FE4|nr:Uma2 family endonuclease [Sphaerospermopsis aphanizomenoides]MBK1988717.1 Uma2 family endonuclease [Sphaerospermopsis aphanizomenoides BCCUSP55]
MITTVERRYSLDEYRAIEEKAEGRNEYHDGEIVPMPGGSLNHSRIGGNIFAFLKFLLRDTQFEPINSDLRLWIPQHKRGVYPDVMVFNGEPQLNDNRNDEVLNPILIVEVLSPSTADYDRQSKFRMYRSIPSFCEYLLVEQDEVFIEKYSKQEQGWLLSDFNDLDKSIFLESLNVELPIKEIYRGVSFE